MGQGKCSTTGLHSQPEIIEVLKYIRTRWPLSVQGRPSHGCFPGSTQTVGGVEMAILATFTA